MHVYIDTNIFLDTILNRDNGIAKEILHFLNSKGFSIVLNDLSIINIYYFASKQKLITEG